MKQELIAVGAKPLIAVRAVSGDLQVTGWDRSELMAKTGGDVLEVTTDAEKVTVVSNGDLILYVPRESGLEIETIARDADLRAILGEIGIGNVGGDLQLRNVGAVNITSVARDLNVHGTQGDLRIANVGDDASLRQVQGSASLGNVGLDLLLNDVRSNVSATVGADVIAYFQQLVGGDYRIQAGGNIVLRIPLETDAELDLQGGSPESIRVDFPDIQPVEAGVTRHLTLGSGAAKISLTAGDEMIVTTRADEWQSMAEFNVSMREGYSPGQPSDFDESVSRRVEKVTRRAMEHSGRAQERAQRRLDAAIQHAEKKMRAAGRRAMHVGVSFGNLGDRSVVSPTLTNDPVTDEERLTILRMLQEKKISLAEAEKLLAALEGR
jgi:hypothetical protein